MIDLEISKAFALAIGWKEAAINDVTGLMQCWVYTGHCWRSFDYRDWNVIGPIAERYDCFPKKLSNKWALVRHSQLVYTDTPQKAIALAVIGANK